MAILHIPRRARPSYKSGYARSAGESVNPELWPDYGWSPSLGYTGRKLIDVSGRCTAPANNATQPSGFGYDSIAGQQVFDYTAKVSDSYFAAGSISDFQFLESELWTVVACGSVSDTSSAHDITAFWRGGDRQFVSRTEADATPPASVEVFHNSSRRIDSAKVVQPNVWLLFCIDNDGTGSATGMRLRVLDTTGQILETSTGDPSGNDTLPAGIDLWGRDGGDAWEGLAGSQYFYKRLLVQSQITRIAQDNLAPFRRKPLVVSIPEAAPGGGRIMSSLVGAGGLAGSGGIAGSGGGLAG